MIAHLCCQTTEPGQGRASNAARKKPVWKRSLSVAGQTLPAAILLLIPKCPACMVVYIALLTGAAISSTTAIYLSTTIMTLCIASLLYIAIRYLSTRKSIEVIQNR